MYAIRGIASVCVVLVHFVIHDLVKGDRASIGFLSVDTFFIMSGFVILMLLNKTRTWKDFAWNRFARLYPTYWTCVTITSLLIVLKYKFLVHTANNEVTPFFAIKYLSNMTMFQYYMGVPNIDGQYWTMIIELTFYFFIIILMITKALDHIITIGTVFMLFCITYSLECVYNNVYMKGILHAFPLIGYFPLFFTGALLYKMKFDRITPARLGILLLALVSQCLNIAIGAMYT